MIDLPKSVAYSFEHGDETLPPLKALVSQRPDPEKNKILRYLRTHCVTACPGIIADEIDPENVIGSGHLFNDGVYYWNDVFANYVETYNIPVPEPFRSHLLANYEERMGKHDLLTQVDCAELFNAPDPAHAYRVRIYRNGIIKYQDEKPFSIKPENARYMIDPIMADLFCYMDKPQGTPKATGCYWRLTFYRRNEAVKVVEGWPGETYKRFNRFKGLVKFIERYIPRELGHRFMGDHPDAKAIAAKLAQATEKGEPSPDLTREEARHLLDNARTDRELAALYAQVEDKAWWTSVYAKSLDWERLCQLIEKRMLTQQGGSLTGPARNDALLAFMARFGFRKSGGWWIQEEL